MQTGDLTDLVLSRGRPRRGGYHNTMLVGVMEQRGEWVAAGAGTDRGTVLIEADLLGLFGGLAAPLSGPRRST